MLHISFFFSLFLFSADFICRIECVPELSYHGLISPAFKCEVSYSYFRKLYYCQHWIHLQIQINFLSFYIKDLQGQGLFYSRETCKEGFSFYTSEDNSGNLRKLQYDEVLYMLIIKFEIRREGQIYLKKYSNLIWFEIWNDKILKKNIKMSLAVKIDIQVTK